MRETLRSTQPIMSEPRTEAGRALLDALPLDDWHPVNRSIVVEHILAIEAEAQAALLHDLNEERACFDEQHGEREP